ncbi:MAG: membrane integrity-associated transporter subunit PqiC [Gammaproteobacteria bacterium]|nr:membrane integrity-associated transporter subunit PqiC [Gammaproteobacteria bacterium]MCW5583247.1 membrane integrity-associated transporter subunit PqiC [Gammaproteobacteria bacterium]
MKFNRIKLMRVILTLFGIVLLSACSFLSPVKVDLPDKYMLSKVPSYVPTKKTRPMILLIPTPETRPIYNTTQMAYMLKPYQIAYFSKNEWAETPAQMLHVLLIQTLQKTHFFKAVVTSPYNGHYDYVLNTEILELKEDLTHSTPLLVLSVRAQIFKISANQIIATKQFTVSLPIPRGTPYGAVFAANQAAATILRQIAIFCLDRITMA